MSLPHGSWQVTRRLPRCKTTGTSTGTYSDTATDADRDTDTDTATAADTAADTLHRQTQTHYTYTDTNSFFLCTRGVAGVLKRLFF